jgi:ribonuclease Z
MTLYLLGTGAAISDPHRTTTMLAVESGGRVVLIDCGGDALQRMMAAGLEIEQLHALILTHEHPDHISGFPLLVEKVWLAGRVEPLPVYGPAAALDVAQAAFGVYRTSGWAGLPDRVWHPVALEHRTEVFSDEHFRVLASPADHPVPTIALRIETGDGTVAYSADTSKSGSIVDLARDADVLVHEATGSQPGVHSSSVEAAQVAAEAGAARLLLVHLPPGLLESDLDEARRIFPSTAIGEELGVYVPGGVAV